MIPSPSFLGLLFTKTKTGNLKLPYSVIIPVHNKKNEIKKTISAVFDQSIEPNNVYIIDDCSTDGTDLIIKELKQNITFIQLKENIGKANAVNKALNEIEDPLVMILDADTYLEHDYAEKMMTGFVDDVVGVSGRVLANDDNSFCRKSRVVEYLYGQRLLKSFQARIGGIWVLTGCATMWETEWLKKVGGMPNNTLVEDLELTWLAERNNSVNYIHNAICYTTDPVSLKEYISQIYRWYSWRPALNLKDFKELKKGLKIIIAWSIMDTFLSMFVVMVMLYSLVTMNFNFIAIAMLIDFAIYGIIACYEGAKVGRGMEAFGGIANCIMLRYINIIVLFIALIRPKKKWY